MTDVLAQLNVNAIICEVLSAPASADGLNTLCTKMPKLHPRGIYKFNFVLPTVMSGR